MVTSGARRDDSPNRIRRACLFCSSGELTGTLAQLVSEPHARLRECIPCLYLLTLCGHETLPGIVELDEAADAGVVTTPCDGQLPLGLYAPFDDEGERVASSIHREPRLTHG